MRFRLFHFIVFIFLVQGVFAQFTYIYQNPVIEDNDTVYCRTENSAGEEIKVRISKHTGKNVAWFIDKNKNVYLDKNVELFACWINGRNLMFQRSADNGKTWLPEEKFLIGTNISLEYKVDSMMCENYAWIIRDNSNGKFKNRIYVCYTDMKYSMEDKDVFLIYSDDKGETWTEPILVTYRPNHKAQFYPQMTIDQNTGFLYLLYLDKQNSYDGKLTDITLAISKNGGLKFNYYKVNKKSFMLDSYIFLFIYNSFDIPRIEWKKEKNKNHVVELNNNTLSAYNKAFIVKENFLQIPKTISFSDTVSLPIQLQDTTTITAVITKPLDPYFEKRVFTEKKFSKGKNEILLDTKKLGLEKGNYTLFLYYNSHNKFVWIVDE